MKTILTVDFDIFMKDSIESYNHMIEKPWKDRFNTIPLLNQLPFDGVSYQRVLKYLLFLFSKIDNKNKVVFLIEHHHILNFLDNDEEYHIVNIDHHHDWCYTPEDFAHAITKVNCGNWVKYLNDTGHLASYTWIKNPSSQSPLEEQSFGQYNLRDCTLENFSTFDEIYIVLSPDYVPPYYHSLFFLVLDMANAIFETHFELQQIDSSCSEKD